MKIFTLQICFFVMVCGSALGQKVSDKGFTDKKEAKNLTVNGLKEGKWIEFPYAFIFTSRSYKQYRHRNYNPPPPIQQGIDSSYRLTIYHSGIAIGTTRAYYPNGVLREISYYSNGKYNGVTKDYYRSGKLQIEAPCKDGKGDGVTKVYYENGKLQTKTPFTDGKCNGVAKAYYENGKPMSEATYKDGIADGVIKDYYDSGKLRDETLYTNGKKGPTRKYNENGNEIK